MDALYVALALMSFAIGLVGIFVPVFLWKEGEPIWRILLFILLDSVYIVAIILAVLPFFRRLSDKTLMLASLPFAALYYLGLDFIKELPLLFYFLPLLHASYAIFFNTGYHINFTGASDGDYLGREIGARHLISSLTHMAAPFLGGLIIASIGFKYTFAFGAALLFFAITPLFYFPAHRASPDLSRKTIIKYLFYKPIMPFTVSGAGYAMETIIGRITWPLFLFIILGSIESLGAIISLGLLAGVFVTFYMGFLSDAGKRRKIILWSSVFLSAIWAARYFLFRPVLVSISEPLGNAVGNSLGVAWESQYYRIARSVPDGASFILSRELLYNAVRIPYMLILMVGAYFFEPVLFLKSSFVIAALVSLMFMFANMTHTSVVSRSFFKNA